ncbi:AbiJ-NTD4 domain-containing protein [uncultured Bacteroides sp.]|uniref:AbiJ-NTD4 domain-containing protein n=1 Tax=uncultured Bacteroides sp. TaxID=162156 RepID=UPI002AAAB1B9|nr:hypothetical protein [uncultured Bacteroides sp.]
MSNFSERNGYIIPRRIYLREKITPELTTAICNSIDLLQGRNYVLFYNLEKNMWYKVFNRRLKDFGNITKEFHTVSLEYIESPNNLWYEKFDYIEKIIAYLKEQNEKEYLWFTNQLNACFKAHNFVYRIVNEQIIETNPLEEDKPKPPLLIAPIKRTPVQNIKASLRMLFQILPF